MARGGARCKYYRNYRIGQIWAKSGRFRFANGSDSGGGVRWLLVVWSWLEWVRLNVGKGEADGAAAACIV